MFHIKFDLSFGKAEPMSPKNVADYLADGNERSLEREQLELAKKNARNERFQALRTEISDALAAGVEEYNADERIGKVFVLSTNGDEAVLSRIDRDGDVTIRFNPAKFVVRFKSTTLTALDHGIEVRMNGQTPYLMENEGRKEAFHTNAGVVQRLVDKAFRALR